MSKEVAGLSTQLVSRVRAILLQDWDPIGVSSFANAADEYDSYAAVVMEMLQAGDGSDAIRDYLYRSATLDIGLDYPALAEKSEAAARQVVSEARKLGLLV